jgi:hypothetical protein
VSPRGIVVKTRQVTHGMPQRCLRNPRAEAQMLRAFSPPTHATCCGDCGRPEAEVERVPEMAVAASILPGDHQPRTVVYPTQREISGRRRLEAPHRHFIRLGSYARRHSPAFESGRGPRHALALRTPFRLAGRQCSSHTCCDEAIASPRIRRTASTAARLSLLSLQPYWSFIVNLYACSGEC